MASTAMPAHHRTTLADSDPTVAAILNREVKRQQDHLELIASENHSSAAVREAMGSVLTDKYAEGYPGKRYYGGCAHADEVETLAIQRVCELYGAEAANVQPHSGASANMAAYFTFMKPGDTLMAMNLAHGGHLTHGATVNFSGQLYNVAAYGVRDSDEQIDYDELRRIAHESRPRVIVSGATAYSREFDFAFIRQVADEVDALHMCDMSHYSGLIAGGVYPSPVGHAQVVTSTTHKSIRGPRGGMIIGDADYVTKINKTVFPGLQGGPLMHVIAAKAVAFGEALRPEFKDYARRVKANAQALAAALTAEGFRIVSGGTDSHLMLVDLRPFGVTGKLAQDVLEAAHMTTNKNAIPNDPEKPFVTSGLRLGTPAVTTRGLGEAEMKLIAGWMARVLRAPQDEAVQAAVRAEVAAVTQRFPLHDLA
ncbi:MAG TPA: serine hydroxymethyltransferase [Fimbriimonadaceae bacterium]|nr:serine hydroxymethyltransferase [Fimbriimonadaceae bacterium]HRE94482.1 serine hydroxymethyltransferase [Fimbriimonadaceae bacterium]